MSETRKIIELGLSARAAAKIKVRQPLAKIIVDKKLLPEIVDIIKEELNVKDVVFDEDISDEIVLDIEISEDLKLEGQAREIIRHIQEMRKEAGYEVDNRIKVCYSGMLPVFEKFGKMIEKEVLSEGLNEGKMEGCDLSKDFEVDGEKLTIQIKKI